MKILSLDIFYMTMPSTFRVASFGVRKGTNSLRIVFGEANLGNNENECDLKALRTVPYHLA